jgi:hypothetical protein
LKPCIKLYTAFNLKMFVQSIIIGLEICDATK